MSESHPPPTPSPVEDGRSQVAGAPRQELSIGTKIGLMILIGCLALGFIWFNALYSHKHNSQSQPQQAAFTGGGEEFEAPPAATPKPASVALPLPPPSTQPASFFGTGNQANPATAPIMAYSGEVSSIAAPATPPTAAAGGLDGEGGSNASLAPPPDNSPLGARLKPTVLDGEMATVLQNPDMVITEGTIIPCTLQTAINSELPSLVTCVVPIDIRGTTGNVVLLDAGTKITGQIESGLLQGQNRVFVDWTRAETPHC